MDWSSTESAGADQFVDDLTRPTFLYSYVSTCVMSTVLLSVQNLESPSLDFLGQYLE